MQAPGEQFLADPGFPQQQHRELGIGQYIQFVEQLLQALAATENLALFDGQVQARRIAARSPQTAVLLLQPGHPHRRLDLQGATLEFLAGTAVEGAGVQRIQGDRPPEAPFHIQAHPHAVVYRQRFADVVIEQAVIRVR